MTSETPVGTTATQAPGEGPSVPVRKHLVGLTWAHLLNDGAANYLPGVLPAVLIAVHQPIRMAGVLIAALTIGQVLQPALGWVADRVGGRWLVVTGLLLSSLGGACSPRCSWSEASLAGASGPRPRASSPLTWGWSTCGSSRSLDW